MSYSLVLCLHVLAATVWTGGHIVLFAAILLPALKFRDYRRVTDFEQYFEKIGIPALGILVVTGLTLAHWQLPDINLWFTLKSTASRTIATKMLLLLLTLTLALHARLRLIPGLQEKTLRNLALHIALVTLTGILFVLTGVLHRFGGIW
ncbi:MAG: CopD family protein [Turneriella sp.]